MGVSGQRHAPAENPLPLPEIEPRFWTKKQYKIFISYIEDDIPSHLSCIDALFEYPDNIQ
jgi:hypothetical protein